MTAQDFYTRLGRLLEAGTIDKDAEVFASTPGGALSPIIAIDPVNRKIHDSQIDVSKALAFGRLA